MHTKSVIVPLLALAAAVDTAAVSPNEAALKQRYHAFVASLDHRRLAEDYPGAIRNLDSSNPDGQIVGIKILAATEEIGAIPWIVPFLDSENRHVRIQAGLSLNAVVATHQLKRRDKSQPKKVVILPPGPGDTDLRPMSWVILKMLKKTDDGNTHAYAANMIGYLGLIEHEGELWKLLDSRHPAVTTEAHRALEMIDVKRAETLAAGQSAKRYSTDLGSIQVALVPDKREIMVGEPVSLSLTVRNLSDTDLQIIQGGDYRNRMGRPESYVITAVDLKGQTVPLLDAGPTMGGRAGPQKIPTRGTWVRRLFLPHWLKLTQAGDYTITCKTTLKLNEAIDGNWEPNAETTDVAVETSTQLTVVAPDDSRMGLLIDSLGTTMLDADSDASDDAIRHLTAIEDERVVPFFNQAATSNDYGLRFAALNGLSKIGSEDALQGIREGMTTQASDMMADATTEKVAGQLADNIRHAAAVALSNSLHPEANNLLLSMWDDPYYGARISVLHALGKMDTAESLQMLRKMADDVNEIVRNEALRYIDLRSKLAK